MSTFTGEPCGPPPPAAIYSDISTCFSAIQAHARANGYAFMQRDTRPNRVVFVCDREGKYRPKGKQIDTHPTRKRLNTGSKKCGCRMRAVLVQDKVTGKWELVIMEATHNHARSLDSSAHPAHRISAISAETRVSIDTFAKAGLSNAQILSALREEDPSVTLTSKDISNLIQKSRIEQLGGKTPIQWLLQVRLFVIKLLITNKLPRSYKTTITLLSTNQRPDPYDTSFSSTPPLSSYGSSILMFYYSIVHTKPTDSICLC